jgi:hypothetical protein
MTSYSILWKYEEFQIYIAAASTALLHAAVMLLVCYGPSKINYSLHTLSKIF